MVRMSACEPELDWGIFYNWDWNCLCIPYNFLIPHPLDAWMLIWTLLIYTPLIFKSFWLWPFYSCHVFLYMSVSDALPCSIRLFFPYFIPPQLNWKRTFSLIPSLFFSKEIIFVFFLFSSNIHLSHVLKGKSSS